MAQSTNVYAEALFALACESGEEETALAAMKEIEGALSQSPDLIDLLSSPAIPTRERLVVAEKAFGATACEQVFSLLCLLCEKRQVSAWSACVADYEKLWEARCAVSTAVVTVAVPMSEEEREALRQALEKKSGRSVRLVCRVDPTILGGVIVEMDGTLTDGSLRHRLQQVKEGLDR